MSVTLASGYLGATDGVSFPYEMINDSTPSEWERGQGYLSSGTFYRASIIRSSNSDSVVSFSAGVKSIICALSAHASPAIHYDSTNFPGDPPIVSSGSIAMGPGTHASSASVSIGQSSLAQDDSAAYGCGAAAGTFGTAVGRSAQANTSTAIGANSISSSDAVAVGTSALGNHYGIAIGKAANANRPSGSTVDSGIVIGHDSSFGNYIYHGPSITIGHNSSGWEDGITLGHKTRANWLKTHTIGFTDDNSAGVQVHHTISALYGTTTDATATGLGSVCSTYNSNSGVYAGGVLFQVDAVGMDSSNNLVTVRIVGAMRNGGIVGTPVTTVVGRSAALSTATCKVSYSSNALAVSVTGMAGITIRWGVTVTATWMAPRF